MYVVYDVCHSLTTPLYTIYLGREELLLITKISSSIHAINPHTLHLHEFKTDSLQALELFFEVKLVDEHAPSFDEPESI
ncbi:hypothetical protein EON63_14140, partial [archaeon]